MNVRVSIVMGSLTDMPVMEKAKELLDRFGVAYEVRVLSAHRSPAATAGFAKKAAARGIRVIIAGAGGAAHLPGVIAAYTAVPVIGVPMPTRSFRGLDSVLSILQMPGGVPVATMAVGFAGARNAAIFAAEILALKNPRLTGKLALYKKELVNKVKKADAPGTKG